MDIPFFGSSQPGDTYYYTPMSVYNLGVVNTAHIHHSNHEPIDHMHCHVYSKGVAGKGSNNVASLIIKTLDGLNLLRKDDCVGSSTLLLDNCSGQNKNNTVLKLVPFLSEMEYFKQGCFVFMVVGHTKFCRYAVQCLKKFVPSKRFKFC